MMSRQPGHDRRGQELHSAGRLAAVCLYIGIAMAIRPVLVQADVIDRILAVVDGAPITQSDVAAAVRLGFVRVSGTANPAAEVLDRMIERRLILAEVDRYAPPEPPEGELDRMMAGIRAQAGSQVDRILEQTGLTLDQLRRHLRDDFRIEAYLQQRFGAIVPSDADLLQYYREHAAEFPPGTFDQVRDRVREALVAERRAGTTRDWLAGLRRRANINVLPR